MGLPLADISSDFAIAFKAVDATAPREKTYKPGIGPVGEDDAVKMALDFLKKTKNSIYNDASPGGYPDSGEECDLIIPNEWVIEFKLIRPFGDNGKEGEHWSKKILHPYPGRKSSIGDCIKLLNSGFVERKAVIAFGYQHIPARIDLNVAVRSFEAIAREVVGISLGPMCSSEFGPLIHPVHQQGRIFAWEVLGYKQ